METTAIVIWIVSIILSTVIGNNKGKSGTGLLLGILLGWIGLIIMIFISAGKQCPECKKTVHKQATICSFCRHKFN